MTYYPMPRVRHSRPLAVQGRRLRAPVLQKYGRRSSSMIPGPLMMLGDSASDACTQAGYQAQQQFTDALNQITAIWQNTTGLYTIDDAQAVIAAAYKFIMQAQAMLDQHRATYGDTGPDFVIQALDQAQQSILDDAKAGIEFNYALGQAQAANATVFNAPGLKQWVINSLIDAGTAAFVVAYTNACEPAYAASIITALRALITLGNDLISLVRRAASVAANVAITAADVVYKTTVGTLSFVASVLKYLPWIAAGVGGLYLWKEYGGGKR